MKKVFISLADRSAANYIYEIFREGFGDLDIVGLTDERLESIGIRSVGRYSEISAVGLTEAIKIIPRFLRLYRRIINEVKKADTLILCDAPALSLKLLKDARKLGVKKVIYFISPQVWAWKPKRAEVIGRLADHLIVILPFERDIYRGFPVKVHYEGHPLVDLVRPVKSKEEFLKDFKKPPLPVLLGSRRGEIKKHLKLFRGIIGELEKDFEPISPTFREYENEIRKTLSIETLTYEKAAYDCFYFSDFSLIASGTASLEAGIALNPHLVYYKVSPLTYLIGKRLVRVPFVSLVNLLLGKEVVPELIQPEPREILRTFERTYDKREKIREELVRLKEILGREGVIERLRNLFYDLIR
ncbi:glycosyltransferase family protein [Aquifex sp.]